MLDLIGRAHAQTIGAFTFINTNDTGTLVTNILNWFVGIIGAIAVVYFVYGGVLYLTAGPDAEKAGKGRTVIVNAIIGIVIVVAAFVIINLVSTALQTVQ